MEILERSLVRLFFENSNSPAGAGFLISKRHILTCAHVVIAALNLDRNTTTLPRNTVRVDFPFLPTLLNLEARVVLWNIPSTENGDDIAIMEVLQDLPTETLPARLSDLERTALQEFKAYGFPVGYPNGIWAVGVLRGRVASGRVQVEDLRQTGYFIEQGFSGTAVWNENLGGVVGMIVSADTDRSVRTAFMIPTQRLKEFIGDTIPEFRIIYHPPRQKKERLLTNLLTLVSFPKQLYVATSMKKNPREVIDIFRELQFDGDEWLLKGGNIFTFHNLDEAHWKDVCDQGSIETLDTDDWAYSSDEDRQRDFVFLLNKCLKSKVQLDLKLFESKDTRYYYFKASEDLRKREYSYHTGKQKAKRGVFIPYGKQTNGKPFYYRHSAFSGHFRRYDKRWYFEITPTYHFTIDGYKKHFNHEEFITKIKRLEHNQAIMGQVRMWGYYLTQEPDAFSAKYPFLTFGNLVSLDANFGLNDAEWLPNEETDRITSEDSEYKTLF